MGQRFSLSKVQFCCFRTQIMMVKEIRFGQGKELRAKELQYGWALSRVRNSQLAMTMNVLSEVHWCCFGSARHLALAYLIARCSKPSYITCRV